jgi:hypothetical protein
MQQVSHNNQILIELLEKWEPILLSLNNETIANHHNKQNRTIKQILGHMVDSATNNTHRIIHLQYQPSPLIFPDYASLGKNDRWIAIQNYQAENWQNLVNLWKYSNLHIIHVMQNVDESKLRNIWLTATGEEVSLIDMMINYLPHFELHINEISELINQ